MQGRSGVTVGWFASRKKKNEERKKMSTTKRKEDLLISFVSLEKLLVSKSAYSLLCHGSEEEGKEQALLFVHFGITRMHVF